MSADGTGKPIRIPFPRKLPTFGLPNQKAVDPATAKKAIASRPEPKNLYSPRKQTLEDVSAYPQGAPSIVEQARALQNDVDLIFQFVHDNIDFVPNYGLHKGGFGALIDGCGNAFDQCDLLVQLLNQSGYTTSYVIGEIQLTSAQWSNWLNIDESNIDGASQLLANGGIANTIVDSTELQISHCWVQVDIDGTNYVFDPSFKTYNTVDGIDLPSVMGYSRSTFLSDAEDGSTITSNYVQNLNYTNITSDVTTYATNLIDWISANNPTATLNDILGGTTIVPVSGPVRDTTLSYEAPGDEPIIVTSIPGSYQATLEIEATSHLNVTLYSADIYAQRLTLWWSSDVGTLYLNGTSLGTTSSVGTGDAFTLTFIVTHPYPTTFADDTQSSTSYGGFNFAIGTSWGPTSRQLAEIHRQALDQNILNGGSSTAEDVLGESVSLMPLNLFAEFSKGSNLTSRMYSCVPIIHHNIAISGLLSYADGDLLVVSAHTLTYNVSPLVSDANSTAVSITMSTFLGCMEGAAMAQVSDTVSLNPWQIFQINNQNGIIIYGATSSNWSSVVEPALETAGYAASDIDNIDSWITTIPNIIVVVCDKTYVTVGVVEVNCYMYADPTNVIPGLYGWVDAAIKGAFGTEYTTASEYNASAVKSQCALNGARRPKYDTVTSPEPIDLFTGRYLYSNLDMSLGNQGDPYSLSFLRTYNSANQCADQGIGLGWNHNWQISATINSDGYVGLGDQYVPAAAASAIAALYVITDVFASNTQVPASSLVIMSIALEWFREQLINNVVLVQFGSEYQVWAKLPNGTYAAPLGVKGSTTLTQVSGNFVYTTPDKVVYTFNSSGQISSIAYPFGVTIDCNYTSGNLTSITNGFRTLTLSYSGSNLSTVSDGNGRLVSYTINATTNNLTSWTDALGNVTNYQYAAPGLLSQVFRPANPTVGIVTNVYDTLNRVKQQIDAYGNTWNYYVAGSRTEEDDPDGNSHVMYFDYFGSVLTDIDALGNETTIEYDGLERPTLITLPEGNSTSFEYDSYSNVLSATYTPKAGSPLSPVSNTFTYDTNFLSKVKTATDGNDNTTTYTYDPTSGRLTQIEYPTVAAGTPNLYCTYNSLGQLQTLTDPSGVQTTFNYDATTHNLLSVVVSSQAGGLNLTTTFTYDAVGNLQTVEDPNGNVTTLEFDSNRRLTQQTDPSPFSYITLFTYDQNDNLIVLQRLVGTSIQQSYSAAYSVDNLVTSITEPPINYNNTQPNPTLFAYDTLRRLQQTTDAQGNIYSYAYDALSRLSQVTDPTGTICDTRTYTDNGYLESITDARNNSTGYAYDGLDRVSTTTYADTTTEQYVYDDNNNITQITTRSGATIGFTYDALNETLTKSPQDEATVSYTYDLAGRLASAATPVVSDDPSTGTFQLFYDSAGRFFKEEYSNGNIVTLTLDSNGNVTGITYPDTYAVSRTYDQLNRLTGITAGAGTVTFQYDPLSRRITLSYGNNIIQFYRYDQSDNLIGLMKTGASAVRFFYQYNNVHQQVDRAANASGFIWEPSTESISYGTANSVNEYPTVGGNSYSYNGNGCLTSDGTYTYTYDTENRLTAISGSGVSIAFEYDPLGRQLLKTVGSTTTQFLYSGLQRIADYNSSGSLLNRFIFGTGLDEPLIEVSSSGTVSYLHADDTGSLIGASDSNGNTLSSNVYSSFGESTSVNSTNFGFTGQRVDPETGLYFYKARYYSPTIGRFLQPDPIGYAGGDLNLYSYVNNDGINSFDQLGLASAGNTNATATPQSTQGDWLMQSAEAAPSNGMLQGNATINVAANSDGDSLQYWSDLAAGLGDAATNVPFTPYSFTGGVRNLTGANNYVHFNSPAYRTGTVTGSALMTSIFLLRGFIAVGGRIAATKTFGPWTSVLFKRGGKGLAGRWNDNPLVRIGWSRERALQGHNANVFRIAIGEATKKPGWVYDLWNNFQRDWLHIKLFWSRNL